MSDLSLGLWDELAVEASTQRAETRDLLALTAAGEYTPFLKGASSQREHADRLAYAETSIRNAVTATLSTHGFTEVYDVEVGCTRAIASLRDGWTDEAQG